jgi:hypothetical protein
VGLVPPLKREYFREGSELFSSWKKIPLAHLTRRMDEGRVGVPLKRECSRERSELVCSWKEPTCSLNLLDGQGKGWGTTKMRVFEGEEWVLFVCGKNYPLAHLTRCWMDKGRGWVPRKKRVFEKRKNKCPKKLTLSRSQVLVLRRHPCSCLTPLISPSPPHLKKWLCHLTSKMEMRRRIEKINAI